MTQRVAGLMPIFAIEEQGPKFAPSSARVPSTKLPWKKGAIKITDDYVFRMWLYEIQVSGTLEPRKLNPQKLKPTMMYTPIYPPYNMVVSIFFSILPICPQYIP